MSELQLRVSAMGAEARDVVRMELVDASGHQLPPFEPGAHILLRMPGGIARTYSLSNDWRERHRYVLGVGRAAGGRGGSEFIHTTLRVGMEISCDPPANNFRLRSDAAEYLFIAGGIGITPVLSMIRWCEAMGKPWRLIHAARNRSRLAFYEELAAHGAKVRFHCDDEQGGPLAVPPLLSDLPRGTQVYCCGPAALMTAVRDSGTGLPPEALHFEWFSAPASQEEAAPAGPGFWIDLRRSGASFFVPEDKSVLEVLELNGHEVPFSCREGVCGTCETAVCDGEPEHRDYVYPESQRAALRSMLICVSRARSERLGLDL